MPIEIRDPRRPPRPLLEALRRGALGRCPACGEGAMFRSYLRVNAACPTCAEDLSHQRADDAPPYLTILIVGHFMVGLALTVEMAWHPPVWLQLAILAPLTILAALLLLPRLKGAIVAQQWALYMHGFDPDDDEAAGTVDDPTETGR
ncbi:MAG TPA: DUF983 domain-containing protein [Kaistiaceae bacterium]|nr:DUF983 domain-containing protein [Kaistiaceae bacterium]